MERLIKSKNGVTEKTRYWVGDNARACPRWKKTKEPEIKWEDNRRQAIRGLARILNCNADPSWYMATLNFGAELEALTAGMTADEALKEIQHQGQLYARRVKRKVEGEVKIVVVPSDMDGQTGEVVRGHLHILAGGVSEEVLRECWKHGACTDVRRLWNQQDYTPLAVYLIKQTREIKNMQKYTCTRNMEKPEILKREYEGDPEKEIAVQPGARVVDRTHYQMGMVCQYVRYIKRPPAKKRGGHKRMACGLAPDQAIESTGEEGNYGKRDPEVH